MSNTKSTRIIAVGVAVFIIGGALLFLVLGKSSSSSSPKAQTTISTPASTTTTAPGSVFIPATPPTTVLQFKIPTGLNAVAFPMDYFAGVAGFVRPGDVVNMYALINKDCATTALPAATKLIVSNVKVLEVIASAPAATGQAGSFLFALSPQDVERVLFTAKSEGGIYLSLTTGNEPPAVTTGVSCATAK